MAHCPALPHCAACCTAALRCAAIASACFCFTVLCAAPLWSLRPSVDRPVCPPLRHAALPCCAALCCVPCCSSAGESDGPYGKAGAAGLPSGLRSGPRQRSGGGQAAADHGAPERVERDPSAVPPRAWRGMPLRPVLRCPGPGALLEGAWGAAARYNHRSSGQRLGGKPCRLRDGCGQLGVGQSFGRTATPRKVREESHKANVGRGRGAGGGEEVLVFPTVCELPR